MRAKPLKDGDAKPHVGKPRAKEAKAYEEIQEAKSVRLPEIFYLLRKTAERR